MLVQIAFCVAGEYASGVPVQCVTTHTVAGAQTFASFATHQSSAAPCPTNCRFCRVATDTAIKVSFGPAPNAGTDAGALLLLPGTELFEVAPGDYADIIAA